ncbi:MAG: PilZ domain-containing protein [Terracidiphilus sp.]
MRPAPTSSQQCTDGVRRHLPRENRRSTVRYALRAKVIGTWTGHDAIGHQLCGYTRDISPGGAYILSTALPALGESVRMSIHLPMFDGEARVPCIDVTGRVLRVDKVGEHSGFSVRNERVILCSA